jgi:predicted  nucleic acid-binding Zn-ribbon protein
MMSDVINLKEFYSAESRITAVENAVLSIEKRFDKIDSELKEIRGDVKELRKEVMADIKEIRSEGRSHHKWTLGLITGLYVMFSGTLSGLVIKLMSN